MNPTNEFTLYLEHCKNPDINDAQRRGYWQPPVSPRKMHVGCRDFDHARAQFLDWIKRNGFGIGNIPRECGTLKDGKRLIGRFEYNGKLMDAQGMEVLVLDTGSVPALPATDDVEEVTGTVTVPKDLWSRLCSLAEGLAWSTEPLALMVDEARVVCAAVDKYYGQPTPGKFQRV